jgi:hypothetical protein
MNNKIELWKEIEITIERMNRFANPQSILGEDIGLYIAKDILGYEPSVLKDVKETDIDSSLLMRQYEGFVSDASKRELLAGQIQSFFQKLKQMI